MKKGFLSSSVVLKIILLFTILFNFLPLNFFAYADNEGTGSLKITRIGDIHDYEYIYCINSTYFQITNNNGEYLCFDSDFNYTGIQTEPYIITVGENKWVKQSSNQKNSEPSYIMLNNIPNGDYKIEFATYNENYGILGEGSFRENGKFELSVENQNVTINNNQVEVTANIYLHAKHNFYLYYIDETEKNPEIIWKFTGLGESDYFKYNYEKDTNGNNIYTYDINGTTEEIKVVNGEKTIVKNFPYVPSGGYIYYCENPAYGTSFSIGSMLDSRYMKDGNTDSKTFLQLKDYGNIITSTSVKKAYVIDKKGTDGNIANADFKLANGTDQTKRAIYNYYETYELNGETYNNVYEVKDVVSEDSLSGNEGVIKTIDGKATIIYPLKTFDGTYFNPTHYELYELKPDEEHILNTGHGYIDTISGENYSIDLKYDGQSILGWNISDNMNGTDFEDVDYDKFEIDYTYDTDKTTKSVTNVNKPSVRKVIINEQGNMINNIDETFTFGLYNSDYKLVSTVDVKANETAYFDVQGNDYTKPGYFNSGKYYIMEMENDNYVTAGTSGQDIATNRPIGNPVAFNESTLENINEKVNSKAFEFYYKDSQAVLATFANIEKLGPSVKKEIYTTNSTEPSNEDLNETFSFGLYNENLELVSTVDVKANETAYFDIKDKNYYKGKYYIFEYKKSAKYTLAGVRGYGSSFNVTEEIKDSIKQNIENTGITFTYDGDYAPPKYTYTFTNYRIPVITVKKEVSNNNKSKEDFVINIYRLSRHLDDNNHEKIYSFTVKAGEIAEINPLEIGMKFGENYFIAEEKKDNFELEDAVGDTKIDFTNIPVKIDIEEIEKLGFIFNYAPGNNDYEMKFVNRQINFEPEEEPKEEPKEETKDEPEEKTEPTEEKNVEEEVKKEIIENNVKGIVKTGDEITKYFVILIGTAMLFLIGLFIKNK